jgi:hypothetical protein
MRWWRSVGLLPNAASGECPSFMCVIMQLLHLTMLSSVGTRCSCAKSLLTFTASNMQGATSDHRGVWTSTTWDPDVDPRPQNWVPARAWDATRLAGRLRCLRSVLPRAGQHAWNLASEPGGLPAYGSVTVMGWAHRAVRRQRLL